MTTIKHDITTGIGRFAQLLDDLRTMPKFNSISFDPERFRSVYANNTQSFCAIGWMVEQHWAQELGWKWTGKHSTLPMLNDKDWHQFNLNNELANFFDLTLLQVDRYFNSHNSDNHIDHSRTLDDQIMMMEDYLHDRGYAQ